MADLWLPSSRELQARVAQQEALLKQMLSDHSRMEEWNRELKQIDERLELVRAQPNAQAPGLKPGFWHVLRHVPGGPPFLMPVEDEDGNFKEPDSSLFNRLKEWDCWDDRVMRDREKRQRKLEEAADKRKRTERREMAEEIIDRYKAANSPGISFARTGPWTYRAGARRG